MKFRTGLIVGAGIGYYLGAKAGRKRYLQLNRAFRQLRGSQQVEEATEKVRAIIDLTRERAHDVFESRTNNGDAEIVDVTSSLN